MENTIFTQHQSKKNDFIIIILFFMSIILFLSLSGYTFLGVQDEVQLQSTLAAGDPRNYMMSYPLNLLISFLYIKVPAIPWYSIMVLMYLLIITFLMSLYVVNTNNRYFKYLLFVLFTLILLLILFDVTVTIISLILIVFSIPLIRDYQLYFWILLYVASLLRVEMIVNISPLILLVYFILVDKHYFNKKNIIIILILISGMALNYMSSSFDKEYKEWLTFQKDRIYFNDKKGTNKKHILTEDEFNLVRSWWINDLDLYPVDKVMQAAGSNIDVMLDVVLTKQGIRRAISNTYHNPILILLGLLTLYILYIEKNNVRRSYYILFIIGFFSLILVKDVQRTTLPVILLWATFLFLILQNYHKEKLIKILLLFLIAYMMTEISWTKIIHYQDNEQLVKEFKDLANRNSHMKLETPSGFTSSWMLTQIVLEQNHLWYEKDGLDYNHNLVLAQWFTMHPLFFKQHDISFKDIKRKYNSYHEYLLDENTGIIGSKGKIGFDPFLANNLLRMYDERFVTEPGCHHQIKVVDQSEHFIINKVVIVCTQSTLNHIDNNSKHAVALSTLSKKITEEEE